MRGNRRLAAAVVVAVAVGAACRPVKPPPGSSPTLFPSDTLTVPDSSQVTGRRINFAKPADCTANKSECDEITLLDQFDGFDLDPTIAIGFASAIDVNKVDDSTAFVQAVGGGPTIGLNRLVRDPSTNTLYGHPKRQLEEDTEYRLVVTSGINGQAGSTTFTTMTASQSLDQMRAQLDAGTAYSAAGITDRVLHLDNDSTSQPAAYGASSVVPITGITRTEDTGSGHTAQEQVFSSALPATTNAGTYAFGYFDAPEWLDATNRTIPTPPSRGDAPTAVRSERVGFALVTPSGTPPAGGWPVAIFGPGITRSKYDVLLASDETLGQGIATISIDPAGHAFGPGSLITVNRTVPPGAVTVTSHGRGVDVDGDGTITNQEGVSTKGQPDASASIALRDGLRQTALDNMAVVRALQRDYGGGSGFAVPGAGTLSRTNITYFAQSLGGIYGTMIMATDPQLGAGVLNVPGGPVIEIARLSPGFRDRVGTELSNRVPSLYNGPSGGPPQAFQESLPLYLDPPITNPAPGAIAIQQAFARDNWIERMGSPETFAPQLLPKGKKVIYQFAFGDQTVPNPTNATLMRAGGLQALTTFYRNDLTPTKDCNPHGFLLDPRITGRQPAQQQVAAFLASGGATIIDPDGPGPVFETPIADPNQLEQLNFTTPPPTPPPSCG